MIRAMADTHDLVVTVEENVVAGGAGSGVNEALAEMGIVKHTLNLGLPDRYLDHGSQAELLRDCGLDATGIVNAINTAYTKLGDNSANENSRINASEKVKVAKH